MITLSLAILTTIEEHALRVYPEECCGLILGAGNTIHAAVPLANVSSGDRRRRYAISPADLIDAQRSAREQGLRIVGVYHSHPDERAYFSPTDREQAVPWLLYLIWGNDGWRLFQPDGSPAPAVVV